MSLTREQIEAIRAGGPGWLGAASTLNALCDMAVSSLPPAGGETKAAPQASEQSTKSEGEAALPSSTPAGAAPIIGTGTFAGSAFVEEPAVRKEDYDALYARFALLQQEVERLRGENKRIIETHKALMAEADRRVEQAERRAEELRERYGWLADKVIAPDYGDNPWRNVGKGKGYWIDRCKGPEWIEGETLDAAIDTARAGEKPNE